MEGKIEDFLCENYKNLQIGVEFKDFRKYQVNLIFENATAQISFTYDNHFTFEINMNSLMNYIDKCIIEYFKVKVVNYDV